MLPLLTIAIIVWLLSVKNRISRVQLPYNGPLSTMIVMLSSQEENMYAAYQWFS